MLPRRACSARERRLLWGEHANRRNRVEARRGGARKRGVQRSEQPGALRGQRRNERRLPSIRVVDDEGVDDVAIKLGPGLAVQDVERLLVRRPVAVGALGGDRVECVGAITRDPSGIARPFSPEG